MRRRRRVGRMHVEKSGIVRLTVAAAALVALGAVAAASAGAGARSEPTPATPVFGGVPGALPPGFHYVYADPGARWPVAVTLAQHPVRGSFLDPRGADDDGLAGYHFGIDVNVDDARPEAGAPSGRSHRVFALESGVVRAVGTTGTRCLHRRVDAGHFAYWHVAATVRSAARVSAGQQIGWSCLGVWHVHISEWQLFRGVRVWVNPLHRAGRLRPYVDTLPPVVAQLTWWTPPTAPWRPTKTLAQPDSSQPLQPGALHGLVEVRAQIADPQSFLGFLARNPAWPTRFSPYRVWVDVRSLGGRPVLHRASFQADQLPQTPYLVHYAPGTVEPDNMQECVGPPALPRCDGTYWYRPFSRFRQEFWDTRTVPNGLYRVTVGASDLAGNVGLRTATVTVKN